MSVNKHLVNIYLLNAKSQSKSTFIKRRGHLEKENRSIIVYYNRNASLLQE
jgi:hypothetical protein